MILLDRRVVDGHAGIVDRLVHDAERIGLRRPAEIVDRLGPVALPAGVDLVDRADLARLRLGDELLVMESPPCRRVAAERLAGIGRVGAGPRLHVDDADFENIAGLGAADRDRPGADVHAEALAGTAAQELAVDGPGAAAVDALLVPGPQEYAFGAGIAFDHALGVVIGMMGQRFDGDVVAGIDLELRLEQLAEIAPMHRVRRRRQIMKGRLARPRRRALCDRGRDQRAAGRCPRSSRATACHEGTLEEAAPFRVELVEQLLTMQFELRTIVIVACAHGNNSWFDAFERTRSRQSAKWRWADSAKRSPQSGDKDAICRPVGAA